MLFFLSVFLSVLEQGQVNGAENLRSFERIHHRLDVFRSFLNRSRVYGFLFHLFFRGFYNLLLDLCFSWFLFFRGFFLFGSRFFLGFQRLQIHRSDDGRTRNMCNRFNMLGFFFLLLRFRSFLSGSFRNFLLDFRSGHLFRTCRSILWGSFFFDAFLFFSRFLFCRAGSTLLGGFHQ